MTQPNMRRIAALAVACFTLLPLASAHEARFPEEAHAVVTIHDTEDGPAVEHPNSCTFVVRIHDLTHERFSYEVQEVRPGPEHPVVHVEGAWQAQPDGDGRFTARIGPMTVDPHGDDGDRKAPFQVVLMMGTQHETGAWEHTQISREFLVDCDDDACGPEDIEFWYGSDASLADKEQGDFVTAEANGPEACIGQELTLIFYDRHGDVLIANDSDRQTGYHVRPHADFAYWDLYADVPDCSWRGELWFGRPDTGTLLDAGEGGEGACAMREPVPPPLDCAEEVAAVTNEDGSVTLTWSAVARADAYLVGRSPGHGEDATWQRVEGTTFHDTTTEGGVTYRYFVTAVAGEEEAQGCSYVDVTAVPFFGAPLFGALALLAGVGAYVAMRRR